MASQVKVVPVEMSFSIESLFRACPHAMLVCVEIPVYWDIVKSLVGFCDLMEEVSEGSSSKLAE